MQATQHDRYPFLDGVRGLGCFLVLARHSELYWGFEIFRNYLTLDLFFILSGFVIAHAYDAKIVSGALNFRKFVVVRLIRLYPLFFISLLFCVVMALIKLWSAPASDERTLWSALEPLAITALFIPPGLITGIHTNLFPNNVPYWSLMFELIVNFIYAAIRRALNDTVLLSLIIASGAVLALSCLFNGTLNMGFRWGSLSLVGGFGRAFFGIFMGLWLCRRRNWMRDRFRSPAWAWACLAVYLLISTSPSAGAYDAYIDLLTIFVVFPVLTLVASQARPTPYDNLLVTVGVASYPIYVLHAPMARLGEIVLGEDLITRFAPVSGVLLFALLLLISVGLDRFYDVPLRRWLGRMAFRKGPVRAGKALE